MNTTSIVTVIGEIDGSVERKVVKEKNLAEFRVQNIALRISAWEQRADQVPDSGIVVVQGYLATRTYTYEGKERTSTDIRATSITTIESAPADDAPF